MLPHILKQTIIRNILSSYNYNKESLIVAYSMFAISHSYDILSKRLGKIIFTLICKN